MAQHFLIHRHRKPGASLCFVFTGLALILAALACNAPTTGEEREALDLPTAAPSAAPSPAPPEQEMEVALPTPEPGGASPLVIEAFGVKASYGASGHTSCQTPAGLILTIRSDGSALLSATGPLFVDTYNCVAQGEETWLVEGSANPSTETVVFATCNMGGFSAAGEISYAGGALSGEVACFNNDGEKSVLITSEQ